MVLWQFIYSPVVLASVDDNNRGKVPAGVMV